jgi:hypothetical protein
MEATQDSYNYLIDTFNEVYAHIKVIHVDKLTPTSVILIMSEVIQLVEKYKNLTGEQKKTTVINVIKRLVNDNLESYSEEEKTSIMLVVNTTLPTMIDTLVNAINGLMKFTKEKTKNTWFNKFLCC